MPTEYNSPEDEENGNDLSSKKKSKTPALDTFGKNLNVLAEQNKIDPVVGRDVEIEKLAFILSRRKKNNPIIIGEPGTGKSALGEGLALKIVEQKNVSRVLLDKKIISLDLGSLVAGTKYRGQFEERMKALMDELRDNPNIILFIDEIHTLSGAGGASGSLDASNMFKPALQRGEVQCIGATTLDEYREYIEKDGALARRFQPVFIEPTNREDTIAILKMIKKIYEDYHRVSYSDEIIEKCVDLADRYIADRQFPDKAIDVLDSLGAHVHINNIQVPQDIVDLEEEIKQIELEKNKAVNKQAYEEAANCRDEIKKATVKLDVRKDEWNTQLEKERIVVSYDDLTKVISLLSNIPIDRLKETDLEVYLNLDNDLNEKIIGQQHAVQSVVESIQSSRTGVKSMNKPIGTYIFLGPTGVGKTLLAKLISKYCFGDDEFVRIDMSEYQEKFTLTRLIGSPPGYVDSEKGGQLTEKVRRKPRTVILLDEIEKAHKDIFNLFLPVLDEGYLTDSLGNKVSFKNTIIIMTSNIGVKDLKNSEGVGFGVKESKKNNRIQHLKDSVKKHFSPEFLNRIDDVIIFNDLTKDDLFKIIELNLKDLQHRLKEIGFSIELTEKAKSYIIDNGYDSEYGARPLTKSMEKNLENKISKSILKKEIKEGDDLLVDFSEELNELVIHKKA